jgi:zinc D-Ala-D-Ala carboxypeptidase
MDKFTKLQRQHWIIIGVFVLVAAAIGFIAFEGNKRTAILLTHIDDLSVQNSTLSMQINELSLYIESVESGFASTTGLLEENITKTKDSFTSALAEEKQNVVAIKEEFGEIAGSVNTLEKLSKTDPELLQKYSKVFFLNEHYAPPRLSEISNEYNYSDQRTATIHEQVWPHLESMFEKAKQDGIEIFAFSAFRSFNTQEALKGQYTVVYGAGSANQFSADQGYSEHQLGTTVDFITTGINGTLPGFDETNAYTWLVQNAYRYGFVLSYPKDNEFYVFEPWHWRFVGVALATELHTANKYFYDLDQREIDEYLVSVFD